MISFRVVGYFKRYRNAHIYLWLSQIARSYRSNHGEMLLSRVTARSELTTVRPGCPVLTSRQIDGRPRNVMDKAS